MSVTSFIKNIGGKKSTKKASKKARAPKKQEAVETEKTEGAVLPTSLLAQRIDLQPLVTEKGVASQQKNQLIFRVKPSATKYQIAVAVREVYKVKPLSVRTMQQMAKQRRRAATTGRTAYWKKAYVTVPDIKAFTV